MILPAPIQNLIDALPRLPGIGPKDCLAADLFPAHAPDEVAQGLSEACTT